MTRAEQKQRREQQEADWRWLFGHAQGRRILAEIIQGSGLLQPTINDSPLRMAHLEGRRSLGGEIYGRLTELVQDAATAALLAEVLIPNDVRNRRNTRSDRDDAEPGAD